MADDDPFASAAPHYAAHRPGYGDDVVDHLADRFDVDADALVLDLGCGTGELAVPLAARAGTVLGMDPSLPMLRQARRHAGEAGRANVHLVRGTDATVTAVDGPLDLTVVGRAFHRMDRQGTLARLADLTAPGGGVALVGDPEWLTRGTADWQDAVYDAVADFVPDLPERTGPVDYDRTYADVLADAGYRDVTHVAFPLEREWDADAVVGYLLSLSFCSPAVLGDDREALEAAVRDRLAAFEEPHVQTGAVAVTSGRVATDS